MDTKKLITYICAVVVTLTAIVLFIHNNGESRTDIAVPAGENTTTTNNFDYKIIHKVNENYNSNYLISPLSIGYAFSMLKEGAMEESKSQVEEVLNGYNAIRVNDVKDRIGVANALFINSKAKNDINKSYINTLKDNYGAEIIFDKFNGPKAVNEWVNDKTFKMIPKALNDLTPGTVVVLVNTVAINLEWEKEFDVNKTHSQEFTKVDGTKMNSAMMKASNSVNYIKSDKAQGIVKSYKTYDNSSNLEYIAILPNGDIKEYINNFNEEEFNKLLGSKRYADGEDLIVNYNLPKYTYDFEYQRIKSDLADLGMKDIFGPAANFKGISENLDLYVDEVIHKTHIEVEEKGTKAAAVTAITFKNAAVSMNDPEIINIDFDKPFIYIIKDVKYNNIWFFGVVYEPMKWENNN